MLALVPLVTVTFRLVLCSPQSPSALRPRSLICHHYSFLFKKKKIFVFTYFQRQERREKHQWLPLTHPLLGTWPSTQACALTGNQTNDLLVHRLVLDPQSHTSQGCHHYFLSSFGTGLSLGFQGKMKTNKQERMRKESAAVVCRCLITISH